MGRMPYEPDLFDFPPALPPAEPQPHTLWLYSPWRAAQGFDDGGFVLVHRGTRGEAWRMLGDHVRIAAAEGWRVQRCYGTGMVRFTRADDTYFLYIDTVLAAHVRQN